MKTLRKGEDVMKTLFKMCRLALYWFIDSASIAECFRCLTTVTMDGKRVSTYAQDNRRTRKHTQRAKGRKRGEKGGR